MSIPAIRHVEARFIVWRGTAPEDLTRFLTRARVDLGDVSTVGTGASGGDGIAATAEFVLANDRPATEGLHPSARSHWNTPNVLLNPNRRVTLDVRVTPEGQQPGAWVSVFDGRLGDSVRVNEKASTVTLKARDHAKVLQDHYFETTVVYGSEEGTRVDLVMQMMLDDELGTDAPLIHVPVTPTFFVRPYIPQFGTLWDALQQLALQTGWYLGYRRHASGEHRLTFMDPPREKNTPDWAFDGSGVITADIDRSDRDVRNAVIVWFTDADTRQRTRFPAAGALIDPASIAEVGARKLMVLEQGSTSQIDTPAEAQALAERALHDLSRQFEGMQVELPITPQLRVFDMVGVSIDAVDSNQRLFAVNNLQHTFDFSRGTARTTIRGSSRVVGKRRQWLDAETRPGSPNNPAGPHQSRLLAPRVTLRQGQPGFIVIVDAGPTVRGFAAVGVEVHVSTLPGFIPSSATLWGRGPEEQFTFTDMPMAAHYVRVRAYDAQNNYGPFSAEMPVTPGWLPSVPQAAFISGIQDLRAQISLTRPGPQKVRFSGISYEQLFPAQSVPSGFRLTGSGNTHGWVVYHWTGPAGPAYPANPDPPVFTQGIAALVDFHVGVEARQGGTWYSFAHLGGMSSVDGVRLRFDGAVHYLEQVPAGGEVILDLRSTAQLWLTPLNVPA